MTTEELHDLEQIAYTKQPWFAAKQLQAYLKTVNTEKEPEKRTGSQHNALFAWFGMIEREAENAGITWDMVIKHTHQLRVTKEALHGMCKLLQKALWGTESTKELNKVGHIDILVQHFTDVFAKVGLEIPPFPSSEQPTYPQHSKTAFDEEDTIT